MTNTLFKSIPIECLKRGQYQPRTRFDETGLNELAQSIRVQGLIEPLVVRKQTDTTYEIIAGERRWRAATIAGLSAVPCIIHDYNDQQAAAVTLIENIQRQDLSLLEEAHGYQRLLSDFHFNQTEIATLTGKSRSHIANLLRLLTLPISVQEHLHNGSLSLGHARMLVGLEASLQNKLARQVIEQEWSVRKLEDEVRATKQPLPILTPSDRDVARLERLLSEQIGAPVQLLTNGAEGGFLKIKYFNNETLDGLLESMGLRYDEGSI